MTSWGFLTNHARVLLCIARDPGVRLRDIADRLGITERSAHGIVADLTEAGYVVKHKDGRRNRYQIQAHMPLPEPASREPAIGEVLALLTGAALDSDGLGSGGWLLTALLGRVTWTLVSTVRPWRRHPSPPTRKLPGLATNPGRRGPLHP